MNNINAQEFINKLDKNTKDIYSTFFFENQEKAIGKKLTGELTISDFPALEEINLSNHELTSLTISNCPNLKFIGVRNNQLTKLELDTPDLEEIIAGQNELSSLDLSNCQKLRKLLVPDNTSLSELKNLNLSLINNINITNTSLTLSAELEALKSENKLLYQDLNK
jgi:hypothetical protein